MLIDVTSDTGGYILGVLWGTMATWEEGYWIRHRDRWYIDICREYLGISSSIQEVSSRTGPQYRLKIVKRDIVQSLTDLLQYHGWSPRKAQERAYPAGAINDRGFCRAWVELHGVIDIRQVKARDGAYRPQKRLRIYGNYLLLSEINGILAAATGERPKKLQATSNTITKALYFQGNSATPVLTWLYNAAEIGHPKVNYPRLKSEACS